MVTTFTYCRSSRKSLGNAAHMSAACATRSKRHLHEERERPGIPQKFAIAVSIHRSPRTFRNMALSSGRRPRLAMLTSKPALHILNRFKLAGAEPTAYRP